MFGWDMVLPIDTLREMVQDHHKILFEKQHQIFTEARNRIKRSQNESINKERKEVDFSLGDAVFYKVQLREGK